MKMLRTLTLLAGSLGVILPGASYFLDRYPPFLSQASVLISGVAIAILFWGLKGESGNHSLRRALIEIGIAVFLLVAYEVAGDYTTVEPPIEREGEIDRHQIGFGLAEWSLVDKPRTGETTYGRDLLRDARSFGSATPEDLMLMKGAYGAPAIIRQIWKGWTIVLAGSLLVALFCGGFLLWTHGFALLARYLSADRSP